MMCAMFGDCHMFTNSIFFLLWLGSADPHAHLTHQLHNKLNKTGKVLFFKEIVVMFSYILVVSRGYLLLISICPILNAGKLHIMIGRCAMLAI